MRPIVEQQPQSTVIILSVFCNLINYIMSMYLHSLARIDQGCYRLLEVQREEDLQVQVDISEGLHRDMLSRVNIL